MFWAEKYLDRKWMITLGLLLIGSMHTMIVAVFQIPENFLMGRESVTLSITCKVILYTSAIIVSLNHQRICRMLGLRKALYMGLGFNLLGILTLLINQIIPLKNGFLPLIYLDMAFFGLALTSVINALITYIIIEFPKRIGLAVVVLFIFLNLGSMLAPILMELFAVLGKSQIIYYLLMTLVCISLWFIHVYFFDPVESREEIHLKKGTQIWKELHYRLALFVVAIFAYGLTETTFNLWGYIHVGDLLGATVAIEIIPFFWAFLIVGQIFLLIPLYFIPEKQIFYFLIFVLMSAAYMFTMQKSIEGFVFWLSIAGFGCSAVFPILLSQMEKELIPAAKGGTVLPLIEKSISLLLAGYFVGVAVIDLWVQVYGQAPHFAVSVHLHLAALFALASCLIFFFLNITSSAK